MSIEKRDENVHQHLLRSLRLEIAGALGLNLHAKDASGPAILQATVCRSLVELDVIIAELDQRESLKETPLNYSVAAIRDRLSLALHLAEGLYDPDDPWETASTIDYYPDGPAAYCAAMQARHGGRRGEPKGDAGLQVIPGGAQ